MEELILRAVELLDNKFRLPNKGILAGGALANTINKLQFGGKCIINDIDIFYIDKIIDEDAWKIIKNNKNNNIVDEKYYKSRYILDVDFKDSIDYEFMIITSDKYLRMYNTETEGKFNYIYYESSKYDPQFLIDTFDINATSVAFDLETRKCYYTKHFEQYLHTKELFIQYCNSPSHTTLRLLKKMDDLDAKLNIEEELYILKTINGMKMHNEVTKFYFSEKYLPIYYRYENIINKYFQLISVDFKPCVRLYRLLPNNWIVVKTHFNSMADAIRGINIVAFHPYDRIYKINQALFYHRVIKKNVFYEKIWFDFSLFFMDEKYLGGYNGEDTAIFKKYIENLELPQIHRLFINMTLKKQIQVCSWLNLIPYGDKIKKLLPLLKTSLDSDTYEELEYFIKMSIIKYRYELSGETSFLLY